MKYELKGLDCPSCASKIEKKLNKLDSSKEIQINLSNNTVELDPYYLDKAQEIVDKIEPGVILKPVEDEHKSKNQSFFNIIKDSSNELIRIILALILLGIGIFFREQLRETSYGEFLVFLLAYLSVGTPIVLGAFKSSLKGQFFNEKFLMTVATVGAFLIREFPEAVAVMLFYAVGEFLQNLAVNRSRRSITALLDLKANYVNLVKDGSVKQVDPEEVKPKDIIEVRPGERVPLDGKVILGTSYINTSALTGESVPRRIDPENEVYAGVINENNLIRLEVTNKFEDSSVSKILNLVENAASRKAPTEKFITTFAGWYTPIVVFGALILGLVPPLVIDDATFSEWIYRSLILLVISCPCALVFSIPLGYFGGIGGASRKGILVKGANFLDAFLKVDTMIFDKTGTLTKGVFKVLDISTVNEFSKEELMEYAALAEAHSNHPIAKSIKQFVTETFGELPKISIVEQEELKGHGIKSVMGDNTLVHVGNKRLLEREGIISNQSDIETDDDSWVHVAINGKYAGYFVVSDEIKGEASKVIKLLKKLGIKKVIMLTGDEEKNSAKVASELGIDRYYSNLLPEDKLQILDDYMAKTPGKVAYVGDGINDAPVITRADIGIAMGALGSDAAIESSDIVLMDDKLIKLPESLDVANRTRQIVIQNIIFALSIKAVFVILGTMGMATMWEAVFADVGVALIAIFNSMRTLRTIENSKQKLTKVEEADLKMRMTH
ncbi:heavy metal translocating P-type ATPase [Natranaerobius trueperi]|uniref:Cd(2+)-exporting ATPase n=1 Tax=Natranaerobius trueperi TaxID=759412 RepID=A0A226BWY7_9FIRM|nr:heavy metal translocating P-type ATPase [Natranaerobius trueperi]OWZ82709.1 cadmium-translocating P-type ATPase [Natranaerobius trueperi]